MLVKVISEADYSQDGHREVLHKVKAKLPESQSYELMLLQGRTAETLFPMVGGDVDAPQVSGSDDRKGYALGRATISSEKDERDI